MIGLIGYLILGAIAGFIASKIVNKQGEGLLVDIILGIVGGIVGGYLFQTLGFAPGGSIIYSLFVAVVGAIIVLVIYHAIFGRRTTTY